MKTWIRHIKEVIKRNRWKKNHLELDYEQIDVLRQSQYQNIYYCCTQKTASQWFRSVFSDPLFYRLTGLKVYPFNQLLDALYEMNSENFTSKWDLGPLLYGKYDIGKCLPMRTIATHFYISYYSYLSIPKPNNYKTFVILRDPRDIVISWYFSTRFSHKPSGNIPKYREDLESLSLEDGLIYSIDILEKRGLFLGQRSWVESRDDLGGIRLFRYEDFAQDNRLFLQELLTYLDIEISNITFDRLYDNHQFKRVTSGRKQGSEDVKSHYRKGVAGDWHNYFTAKVSSYFSEVTKDLLGVSGYSS